MVVLCLAFVHSGSKTSKRKQAKLCLKSMGTVEKKCVEKGRSEIESLVRQIHVYSRRSIFLRPGIRIS